MDSSRTRFLLRALRPNGADDDDPVFHEALGRTHADPELGAWFARERSVDRALAAKLREVRAPADLRAQILQGVALSGRAPARRRPLALFAAALAAAASIALVIYTLMPRTRAGVVPFDLIVTAAVRETAQPPALAFTSDSSGAVRTWLEGQAAPVPDVLPGRLTEIPTVGGSVTEWQGVRCSLITLRAPELAAVSPDNVVHLYVVPRRSCSSEGVGPAPRIETRPEATVATWRDARNYYIVVAHAPAASLQALLGPTAALAWAGEDFPATKYRKLGEG